MKKTFAKSMTAVMAAAMIAGSLTACGGGKTEETTVAETTVAETSAEASEEETTEAAEESSE